MKRALRTAAALVLGLALENVDGTAQTIPLEVKKLSFEEAQRRPGGYGDYGAFWTRKPETLKRAPAFQSTHPLYATLGEEADPARSQANLLLVLDESRGSGKGYDRLHVDLNANGDVTDDPTFERVAGSGPSTQRTEFATFGPVELPQDRAVGPWRPRFYAEVFLYNKRGIRSADTTRRIPIGQVRVQTADHLEALVEVNGVKQRFGVVDGNCDFRIGEPAQLIKFERGAGAPPSWYLRTADFFLRDRNSSGDFSREASGDEAEAFARLVYFGGRPFEVTLAADLRSITFAPFAGAVGEVRVPAELSELVLARQQKPDAWEAVTPGVQSGRIVLPEGTYRVVGCTLGSDMKTTPWIRLSHSDPLDASFQASAAAPVVLDCGLPLKLEVTTERDNTRRLVADPEEGFWARLRNWWASLGEPEDTLRINVSLLGAGRERYTGFTSSEGQVQPPRFEIRDAAGKQLASGKFEFG